MEQGLHKESCSARDGTHCENFPHSGVQSTDSLGPERPAADGLLTFYNILRLLVVM